MMLFSARDECAKIFMQKRTIRFQGEIMDDIFQIFRLLAYLAIGLISITVPTYAITVSYLARETKETLHEMKKRRADLSEKLEELRKQLKKEPGVQGIKEEIERFEEEEVQLKDRLQCLSVKGAVGYPLVGFMLGLIFAGLTMFMYPDNFTLPFLASIFFIAYGLYRIAKSLLAVEQAALRPEEKLLPMFRVSFASGALVERFKAKEEQEIEFNVVNHGKEVAEDVNIMFFFPSEFKIVRARSGSIVKQQPTTRYAGYNSAYFEKPVFHSYLEITYAVRVKMPDKKGKHKIPVCIRAKKVERSDHQLIIQIT